MRVISAAEAAREATEQLLAADKSVIVIGEGVPDPKACFGTTTGLREKFPDQVFDSPVSENGVTGVCIGAALNGLRPIHIHMRQDFLLYAMDQIVNNAAKWHSMFGGNGGSVPIVIKAFTGRGWGAGHQHAQNLESMFAHVPGLKVVVPSTARNAKGLLIAAARDANPVMILESRWIHHTTGNVPKEMFETEIGKAEVWHAHDHPDITIVSWGQTVLECHKACLALSKVGVAAELLDLQSLRPWDSAAVGRSFQKSGKMLVVQDAWFDGAFAHTIAGAFPGAFALTNDNCYPSSSPALTRNYYPHAKLVAETVAALLGADIPVVEEPEFHDIPDKSFTGPF